MVRRAVKTCTQAVTALSLLLCGAGPLRAQFLAPPRADSGVRSLLSALVHGDTAGVTRSFDSTALAGLGISHDSLFHLLSVGFDIGPLAEVKVIDRGEFHPFGATRVDEQLTYHVIGQRESRLLFVAASSDSGQTRLTGMRWQAAPKDLRQMNPFTLGDKSWLHYVFLALAVSLPLFSVFTSVAAVRSQSRHKWLWAGASLIGIGKLGILWVSTSAGQATLTFNPLNLQLLSASYFKYPMYAPWVISIAFPVFALGYWAIGRRYTTDTVQAIPDAA